MRTRNRGVTLIELVVVVAVIGILASIAVPAYRDYIMRANRSEARSALLALATAQEKYYLECNSYVATLLAGTANTCPGKTGSLNFPASSENGYYTISITGGDDDAAGNPQSWWAVASPPTSSPQKRDSACQNFYLDSTGRKRSVVDKTAADASATPGVCWEK